MGTSVRKRHSPKHSIIAEFVVEAPEIPDDPRSFCSANLYTAAS